MHYFEPLRSLSLYAEEDDYPTAPLIAKQLKLILKLFQRFPDLHHKQSWLVLWCISILETPHKHSKLDHYALNIMKMLVSSQNLKEYIISEEFDERIYQLNKVGCWSLQSILEKDLWGLERQFNVNDLRKKVLLNINCLDVKHFKLRNGTRKMRLTKKDWSDLMALLFTSDLYILALQLMSSDSLFKKYMSHCTYHINSQPLQVFKFLEVLAINPNGTRDFKCCVSSPMMWINLFECCSTLYCVSLFAGLICELSGFPKSVQQDTDDMMGGNIKDKMEGSGFLGAVIYSNLRKKRIGYNFTFQKEKKNVSSQFKHIRWRLKEFFQMTQQESPVLELKEHTSMLTSLYKLLCSDTWRNSHTKEDEITFLEVFVNKSNRNGSLSNKVLLPSK